MDALLNEVSRARDEIVEFAAELIRIPTTNPPGENYQECAWVIGKKLREFGFQVEYLVPDDRPEHSAKYPRLNVIGQRRGEHLRPLVHLNGHMDVVPAGQDWAVDPLFGNGS